MNYLNQSSDSTKLSPYPKISVIVPMYGVEMYIEECARSLFEQTLDSIEYIFVDDCSPDNSGTILQEVINNYPHREIDIKIITNTVNLGAGKSREVGLKEATGRYVIFCDSDDFVEKNMYELMYNKITDEKLDMVICNLYAFFPNGKQYPMIECTAEKSKESDFISLLLQRNISGYMWNKLVKAEIYKRVDFVHPKQFLFDDVVTSVQAIYYSNNIGYIDDSLYYYRQMTKVVNPDVVSRQLTIFNQAKGNIDLVISFLNAKGIDLKYSNDLINYKFAVKCMILKLAMNRFNYCKYWSQTYKDINWKILWYNTSVKRKVKFYLTLFRILPAISTIYRVFTKKDIFN